MKPLKVAHLTSAHPDGDIRIFHKECVSLAMAGYEVIHIVPNTERRIEKGVQIEPVINKTASRLNRMRKTVKLVYQKALEVDADIYHIHDPELIRIGLKLRKKGKIVVYDAHEDTPRQILAKSYLTPFLLKLVSKTVEKLENYCAKRMSAIVTATPFITDRFSKINGNCITISNFPLFSEIDIEINEVRENVNAVCYIGGISKVRGIFEMIAAAELSGTELKVAGNWPKTIEEECKKLSGWNKVQQLGFCSRQELLDLKATVAAGLVVLSPTPNHINSYPIKMFEYMASGLPVIASDFPLWREFVVDNNCGLCIDASNPKAIATAIKEIIENPDKGLEMGKNGAKMVREKWNWDIEKKKLFALYDSLAKEIR